MIAVWLCTLDVDAAEIARLAGLLDPEERARAARFRLDAHRRRFVVRRGRLRERLAEHVDERPERLRFETGRYGKPALTGGPPFSASHRGEVMMVAIADAAVGCDVETIDPALDWRPIAERIFSSAERGALAALPDDAGARAFFACWVRKEAFVKAIGRGLSHPLDSFDVSVGDNARLLRGGEGWSIASGVIDDLAWSIVAQANTMPTIQWIDER